MVTNSLADNSFSRTMIKERADNSLKPTVTNVTLFAEKQNPVPRYGDFIPPIDRPRMNFN